MFGQGSRAPVAITILVKNPESSHEGCRILYRDIGDYLTRERKLDILREANSIAGIDDWRAIAPDPHHDWIRQRDDAFRALYPVGSKETKAGRAGRTQSSGCIAMVTRPAAIFTSTTSLVRSARATRAGWSKTIWAHFGSWRRTTIQKSPSTTSQAAIRPMSDGTRL